MQFEFVPDPAWVTMKAFGYWLQAVEIFLVLGIFVLAYCLIKAVTQEKENDHA